jgi:hypothetical protein
MQEEKALDHLIESFKNGFKPFPKDLKGISDCRRITYRGGIASCEDLVDRDDGDMNEYRCCGIALVPQEAILNQALSAIREGRSVMTYESLNFVDTYDRRSESPGSPDERKEHFVPGWVCITMDATTQPPTLEINVRSSASQAKPPWVAPSADTRSMEYIQRHGYEMNG